MASLTYANIETRVANELRIPTSNSTEMTKLQAVINTVYRTIGAKADWRWLLDRQVLNTVADITTGTVSVTSSSAAITFSSAPATSVAGRVLHVPGNTVESATYRINAHTAASTSATLESAYTGATDTAAGYSVWQDRYDLATDVGKVLVIRRHGYTMPLDLIGIGEMERRKQFDVSEGPPQAAAIYGYDTEGDPTTQQQIHLWPYPDETYQLVIWYRQTLNTELSTTTRPLLPDDWVNVLIYGSLADGYAIFLNDLERAAFYQAKFTDLLNLMVARLREHQDPIGVRPAENYRQHFQSRRRVTPATADLGSFFDRWPAGI